MTLFSNISTEGAEEAKDVVGGAFDPIPTGIYDATVKLAYAGESAAGAKNVTVVLDVDGREVKETIYVTNREGQAYYIDKNDGKTKHVLPGFATINDLCLLTTEMELTDPEQPIAEKTIKVYDPEAKAEVNKPVPVLTEMLTKPVKVAINREIVDKQKKGDDGKYHNTGETRTQNVIVKFMHPETSRTVLEYKLEQEEPVFATEWADRWTGKDRNRSSGGSGAAGASGTGRPGASGGASKGKTSLFGNK